MRKFSNLYKKGADRVIYQHVWHPYYIGGIPLSIYISNQFLTIVFPWGVNTLSGWNWMP